MSWWWAVQIIIQIRLNQCHGHGLVVDRKSIINKRRSLISHFNGLLLAFAARWQNKITAHFIIFQTLVLGDDCLFPLLLVLEPEVETLNRIWCLFFLLFLEGNSWRKSWHFPLFKKLAFAAHIADLDLRNCLILFIDFLALWWLWLYFLAILALVQSWFVKWATGQWLIITRIFLLPLGLSLTILCYLTFLQFFNFWNQIAIFVFWSFRLASSTSRSEPIDSSFYFYALFSWMSCLFFSLSSRTSSLSSLYLLRALETRSYDWSKFEFRDSRSNEKSLSMSLHSISRSNFYFRWYWMTIIVFLTSVFDGNMNPCILSTNTSLDTFLI